MTVSIQEAITEVDTASLAEFALDQDVAARCNQAAALAGHLELTVPSADQLTTFLHTGDHVILVAVDGGQLVGFAVVRDTGRIRWLVMAADASADKIMEAVAAIGRESFTRFAACFGRVSNPALRALILGIPEVVSREPDPEVLEWQ